MIGQPKINAFRKSKQLATDELLCSIILICFTV